MEARMTYRQLGKPMLVICEKPKSMEPPALAPADVVADDAETEQQQKGGDGYIYGQQHSENVRKAAAWIGPQPVRGGEFHRNPHSGERHKVLPRAARFALGGSRQG